LQLKSFFLVDRVSIGSLEHIIPIVIAIVVSIFLINYSKRQFSLKQKQTLLHATGVCVSLTIIIFHLYHIIIGAYNFKTDLPLFLCSFMALIIPIFTYYRKYWMYEILLFWIIAGTSQAVITPDIPEGFPSLNYFRYWIIHLGLLFVIFYATFVFGMRPVLKSIFKSVVALMLYMVLMIFANYMLDANYSYLNYKPESASVLDYLGEWPWYLIQGTFLIIPYFLIIYAFIKGNKSRKIT